MASGNPNETPGSGDKSPTALLPNNAFGGKSPEVGDVCRFRVVRVYDDQAEVEYESSDKYEEAEPETEVAAEPSEGEMSQYLE